MKTELRPVRRALVSVSDKSGLDELARALVSFNVEIISTGGTAASLRNLGIAVTDVADVTGFPEIMDGRVKTLHPRIHGGLLAVRGNSEHEIARISHGIDLIDLLIVNLYPFETALDRQMNEADCIENIDVGGPAMIRAAAKNHASVAVIVDPMDYGKLIAALRDNNGRTTLAMRKSLAGKAFARTASYDAAIANWFARSAQSPHPDFFSTGGARARTLRYGENPHQTSALYRVHDGRVGLLDARQMQGKELSYNNINDADAALEAVAEFSTTEAPCCVIVKHANPCGVATGKSLVEAYRKALACDPISAFGGIIACNRLIDRAAAEEISKIFTEVILAPGVDDAAAAIISAKKNLRLLVLPQLPDPKLFSVVVKSVAGGLLVQSRDNTALEGMELQVVTKRHPSSGEMSDLRFAWIVAKHVKSNAIVLAKDGATVGIGAGQMSRIDSTRIAAHKSAEAARAQGLDTPLAKGAVLASDAFFPFADGIVAAADAGATAIIQPGGSIRDDEVIAAADERGLAMVFTGQRHFRH